jgi:hypothetical protein
VRVNRAKSRAFFLVLRFSGQRSQQARSSRDTVRGYRAGPAHDRLIRSFRRGLHGQRCRQSFIRRFAASPSHLIVREHGIRRFRARDAPPGSRGGAEKKLV